MSRLLSFVLVVVALSGSLHALPVGDQGNAWERSGKFQGDIVFRDGKDFKNGLLDPVKYWPNRTLLYKIAPDHFNMSETTAILEAFAVFEELTCVRMREAQDGDEDYVYVKGDEGGCWSYVGRLGGRQNMNLASLGPRNDCFRQGAILHETLHALGFYHQQSATDRDDYVTIHWENIYEGSEYNFEKFPASVITDFGVRYDYGSLLHYSGIAFSSNGEPTIVPLDPTAEIGQMLKLSDSDIEKLDRMYGCRK